MQGIAGPHASPAGSEDKPKAGEEVAQGKSGGLAPIGPDGAQIEVVRRSWFGSWIGRATALVLMFAAYVGAVWFVLEFWDRSAAFRAQYPVAFWAVLAAGLVIILLFSVLSEALRLWRDRRLRAAAIEGG